MREILIVIPARYASTRLPGKPLLQIAGKPLIQWAYESVERVTFAHRTVVATDSPNIVAVAENFGAETMLTSAKHLTGTDRTAEVSEKLDQYDIVINYQGDTICPESTPINALAMMLQDDPSIQMAAVKTKLNPDDVANPAIIKVVTDKYNRALYFTRAPVPYPRVNQDFNYFRNTGIYGFRRDFLLKFTKLPQLSLEKTESLEQLRALEHGYQIRLCESTSEVIDINIASDIQKAMTNLQSRINGAQLT